MEQEKHNTKSVAELLGLPAEECLYATTYAPGSEPTAAPRRCVGRRARRVDPRVLDPYLPDARAGACDRAIAKSAGVTTAQVGKWRREREVARPRGRPSLPAQATSMAVELLGHPFEPVVAEVRGSSVGGRFQAPEYVLRDGLDYDMFVEFISVLRAAGFRVDEIALGLGVRPHDVEIASVLAERAAA